MRAVEHVEIIRVTIMERETVCLEAQPSLCPVVRRMVSRLAHQQLAFAGNVVELRNVVLGSAVIEDLDVLDTALH